MANSHSEWTGALIHDGDTLVITPVIATLFSPFNCDGGGDYIGSGPDEAQFWDCFESDDIALIAERVGVSLDQVMPNGLFDIEGAFRMLLAAKGINDSILDSIDFSNSYYVQDALLLATHLNDGHNVTGIKLSGAYYCDKLRQWEQGGFDSFTTGNLDISTDTQSDIQFFERLDRSIAENDVEAASEAVASRLSNILSGIKDEAFRVAVTKEFAGSIACIVSGRNTAKP